MVSNKKLLVLGASAIMLCSVQSNIKAMDRVAAFGRRAMGWAQTCGQRAQQFDAHLSSRTIAEVTQRSVDIPAQGFDANADLTLANPQLEKHDGYFLAAEGLNLTVAEKQQAIGFLTDAGVADRAVRIQNLVQWVKDNHAQNMTGKIATLRFTTVNETGGDAANQLVSLELTVQGSDTVLIRTATSTTAKLVGAGLLGILFLKSSIIVKMLGLGLAGGYWYATNR